LPSSIELRLSDGWYEILLWAAAEDLVESCGERRGIGLEPRMSVNVRLTPTHTDDEVIPPPARGEPPLAHYRACQAG
jgi:hypothetical protein